MLEEIRIGSLGVIESSTLELGPGLTVITGETGAGKTMIVTALGLLLGGRADTGAVRTGARTARVEGVVRVAAPRRRSPHAVEDAGGEVEDDRVVLARNVSAEGRSRAFVGGASVPVSTLAEVAEPLVAVHGQSDQHRLLQARAQREALDRFGGAALAGLLATYADLHRALDATERELDEVVATRPRPGPRGRPAALRPRRDRGGRAGAGRGRHAGGRGVPARLRRHPARRRRAGPRGAVERARASPTRWPPPRRPARCSTASASTTPRPAALADRLAEVTYLLSDVAADVASYAARIDTDPARLAGGLRAPGRADRADPQVRRHRRRGARLGRALRDPAARPRRHRRADRRAARRAARAARASSPRRRQRCPRPAARPPSASPARSPPSSPCWRCRTPGSRSTSASTRSTAPDGTRRAAAGGDRWLRHTASGIDEVELLLAANTGSEPRPLHKGASGGELSRVMLALEVALAGTSPVPTFVFDEVDAGVGGSGGGRGRPATGPARPHRPGAGGHPPAAGRGVRRPPRGGREVQRRLGDQLGAHGARRRRRERELSRMLAGLADSDTALAHARELLEVAQEARALPDADAPGPAGVADRAAPV